MKLARLATAPPGVTTWRSPFMAPAGTMAVIWVSESTVKLAFSPHEKTTSVAPARLSPVMVTAAPTGPLVGEKLRNSGRQISIGLHGKRCMDSVKGDSASSG